MRVLQLIDSLRPGGAEKMAVNIANALLPLVEGSYLCCTRQEGMLKDEVKDDVGYVFLNKKHSLDPKAILKLRKYITENKIDIVHAHSTSYFLAGILKLSGSSFKLIWHDHYGESEFLEKREYKVLKKFSRLFERIISVNTDLKNWAVENLHCKNVIEIKNFIPETNFSGKIKIRLKGNEDDFKIICVANLRPQKDHMNLLLAFEMLEPNLGVSLHLIGEDPATEYSASVLKAIKNSPLKHKIYYYGTIPNIIPLLHQANLGVLASRSEGLPLALLEYGLAELPVVCTDVGKCRDTIEPDGRLVSKENPEDLAKAILFYYQHPEKREMDAGNFQQKIKGNYSEKEVILNLLNIYKNW
ncbi:MAG: glycosyltransferase [Gillisia sp.]